MKICGLQKTTLLDFPGHVAATVFLGVCNFRCPFCHNSELLDSQVEAVYTQEEVLFFLKKRASMLEGVCITGGEPTLFPDDLETFIRKIRELGLLVKLDTNGYRPDVLKRLCQNGLLDYVAMDIKAARDHYTQVAGVSNISIETLTESIEFLKHGDIPYEFRTTVVKGLHTAADFSDIGLWLQGGSQYFLQNYVESERVLVPGFSSFSKEELLAFGELVKPYVSQVALRGIDY
ncbi:MAG: anaerobic ribonucleoside-triphosphate reductase activating protein [Lachnospiraceae bacterium]